MEAIAILKYARTSAQKARVVADQVRGLPVSKATQILKFHNKKAAIFVKKTLDSAIANAEHNHGADIDMLKVTSIYVDHGPRLKRMRPRARGRANRIIKPSCHITIVVTDFVERES